MIVPDSNALRVRRSKLHASGDHSLCKPERPCRMLSVVPVDARASSSSGLVDAVAAEFAGSDDETVRQLALRLAELADQPGPQSVAACRALGELVAAQRDQRVPQRDQHVPHRRRQG